MTKRILVVLSEYGYWGEELLGPLTAFDREGYRVDFVTATGKRAHALPPSLDPGDVDPPLGRGVTTPAVAVAARELDGSDRLDSPLDLRDLVPDRPYASVPEPLRAMEAYYRELA